MRSVECGESLRCGLFTPWESVFFLEKFEIQGQRGFVARDLARQVDSSGFVSRQHFKPASFINFLKVLVLSKFRFFNFGPFCRAATKNAHVAISMYTLFSW